MKNPALVLSKLNVYDFDEEETLNFSLLSHLLTLDPPTDCLLHLVAQLQQQDKFDFISQYLALTPVKEKFVICVNTLWPGFFGQALEKRALTEQQICQYSHDTLFYSPEEDIKNVNGKGCLTRYISSRDDYLNVQAERHTALMRGLILLDVKFQKIDDTKSDDKLLMQVYEQSCYALNYDNIALMLMIAYGIEDDMDIRHRNYWAITSKRDTPLCKYVEQEIETYVDIMLEFCEDDIQDYELAAIEFLNHSAVSIERKRLYISKLSTMITSLKDIEDSMLWPDLMNAGLIAFSETNLMDYWLNARKFDTALIRFINSSNREINLATVQRQLEDSVRSELFGQIVVCNELSNDKYIQMLKSMGLHYKKGFGVQGVPDDKMQMLVDADIILLVPESLKAMRSNYPNVCYQFIRKNINKYVSMMTSQLVIHDEVVEILSWEIGDEAKLSLLKHSNTPISVVNKGYTESITLYILENRLDESDMQTLCVQYPDLENEIQKFVIAYVEKQIGSIINGSLNSSDSLQLKMLSSPNISESNKYKLLFELLSRVDKQSGASCFKSMRLTEFVKIFDSHAKPKIPKNDQNKKILDILVNRGWIHDYPDHSYDSEYYTVRRNAPSKKRTLAKV